MTSGLEWKEKAYTPDETIMRMYGSPDRTEFVLSQPMSSAPGTKFYYNSGNPYVLSALITKKTGQSASTLQRRSCSDRLASRAPNGVASMARVSRMARPAFLWRLSTWPELAISTFTTECGTAGRSLRHRGSNGPGKEAFRRPLIPLCKPVVVASGKGRLHGARSAFAAHSGASKTGYRRHHDRHFAG